MFTATLLTKPVCSFPTSISCFFCAMSASFKIVICISFSLVCVPMRCCMLLCVGG